MCKFVVLFISIFFLMSSCNFDSPSNNTIHNESSFDVTFSISGAGTDIFTVLSGDTFVGGENWAGALVNIFESCVPNRVEYQRIDHSTGRFIDLIPIELRVYNTLSIKVELSARGFMGIDPMPNIQPGYNSSYTNTIYTRQPSFVVTTTSFPARADYQIVNNIMYVKIY